MFTKALRLAVVLLTLALSPTAQEPAKAPAAAPDVDAPEADPEELRKTVKAILKAAKSGDSARLTILTDSLMADDLSPWAKATFGEPLGTEMARKYAEERKDLANLLQQFAQGWVSEGLSDVEIVPFNTTCREDLTDAQRFFLASRLRPVPFFEVLVLNRGRTKGRTVRFFAEVDGRFRFLGAFRFNAERIAQAHKLPDTAASPGESPPRVVIGGNVQQARLIKLVRPRYPPAARQSYIQGTVRLEAVIGKDGRIYELHVVSGHCLLAEAAAEAVRQWRYTPTMLEGQPVEVLTTIDVVFTLSR